MKKIISLTLLIIFSISTISLGYDSSSSYIWSSGIDTSTVYSSDILETNSEPQDNNSLNLESGAAI